MNLDLIRTTISCKVPTTLWGAVRNIASYEEISMTEVLIRALKKEVESDDFKNHKYELGDRVSATSYDDISYTNFLLACVDNRLGIYKKNGIADFTPLDSFKQVEKL